MRAAVTKSSESVGNNVKQGEGRGHRKKTKKEFFRTTFPSQLIWKKVEVVRDSFEAESLRWERVK